MKTNGTTCGLKEIMIGRCYEFQYIKRGFLLSNQSDMKNCTEIYELFERAVRYKPFCNMNMSTYEKFFTQALSGVHVINRALFWSSTYEIAHIYGDNGYNYITLEDTLGAAMVDGLMWCGKDDNSEGFDFISCPDHCQDNKWADFAFWGIASQMFAELATGEVYVLLNGSRIGDLPSFRNDSYFAVFELANLRRNGSYRVTKMNVFLLHSPDQKVVERCGEKSLIHLEYLVRSYGFDYECLNDPEDLILIMCSSERNAHECQTAQRALRAVWDGKVSGKSNIIHRSMLMIFICVFLSYIKE